ncbi:hypothetical protein OsJ_21088 [Oryza sativa Japonica Group]|uniref:Uncharacterized protein n=1 Tax=Oryza sativa subsp. japonica TaxID=39947 RepID=B9FSW8_ORYSJ|nr:hypothetical protein OsJ_21088 [Oryza sativa Japonica Group]
MEVLLPLLLACSLLFTIATPIRDITDVCASQISDFQPLLAGAAPLRPPLLRRRHPRRRPHRPPRLAPRQQPPDIAVVIVSPPRPPQEEGRRRRRLAGVVVVRAADAGRVGGRRQLRDPPGPRHAGDLLRDGGRHGVVAHLLRRRRLQLRTQTAAGRLKLGKRAMLLLLLLPPPPISAQAQK